MSQPHLLVFDLFSGGHHGEYLEHLATYWADHQLSGRLDVVVPRDFVDAHPSLGPLLADNADAGLRLVPIEEDVHVHTPRRLWAVRSDLEHGRLLERYVAKLRPTHALAMFFDHLQLSLSLGLRLGQTRLSGIYFRPSFHYGAFENSGPSLQERLQRFRKRLLLYTALRNQHVDHLFSLDPFAVPYIQSVNPSVQTVFLPEPFLDLGKPLTSPFQVRKHLGIEDGRKVFFLFGALDHRKGLFQVLDALDSLSPREQEAVCLLLSGRLLPEDRDLALSRIGELRRKTQVQVVLDDRFIEEAEVQERMQASDIVLVTYQRHIGSSGVLVRAATAGVPVLASDYGIVGAQTRRHRLGLTVDATSPQAIAEAVRYYLQHPEAASFEAEFAQRFADQNSAKAFAKTIFSTLGLHAPGENH